MYKKWLRICVFVIFCVLTVTAYVLADKLPRKFPFKDKNALSEWQEKVFRGRVFYSIKTDKTGQYLSAYSNSAASGIFYEIKFNPKELPMISWYWKVLKFPAKAVDLGKHNNGEQWIEKDDYAARVYVIFPRLSFNLTKCLEYVWDKNLPIETIITSPYSDNIKLIVVGSGKSDISKWVFVERNIREDYKKAFGREPGHVGAIAIMTDTDNTQSTAEAHYKELKVGYKNEDQDES
jgi:hypothetical protein